MNPKFSSYKITIALSIVYFFTLSLSYSIKFASRFGPHFINKLAAGVGMSVGNILIFLPTTFLAAFFVWSLLKKSLCYSFVVNIGLSFQIILVMLNTIVISIMLNQNLIHLANIVPWGN